MFYFKESDEVKSCKANESNENKANECKLVIFDLDGTLHSFDDMHNKEAIFKKDILDILITLKQKGIKIALASLNSNAIKYLDRYKITEYFDYIEYKNWGIYGNFKMDLFQRINEKSNIPFQNMLLFDDNASHCKEASVLEIKTINVDRNDLLTWNDFYKGMMLFIKTEKMITVGTQTYSPKYKRNMYKNKNKKRKIIQLSCM